MRIKILIGIITILLLLTGCGIITGLGIIKTEEKITYCSPNITIASFNIRKFSDTSRNDEELDKITEVLKQFDLIAVQEIIGDVKILNRTVEMLAKKGKKYNFVVSEPMGNVQKERYAFLFNKKLTLVGKPKIYYDKYDKFIREPYFASFKSGEFDFDIFTVHILYGDNAYDREPEMRQIANVYSYYQENDAVENDLILTGDFNTRPWDDNFDYIWAIPNVKVVIRDGESTIGKYGNLYDNIIFTESSTQEYTGLNRIYTFDKILELEQEEARNKVSDHRPVYAVFCTGEDDD
ncbi:endonuclease/exonuclease/phosphatase family protein [Candidatus Woesearchaeota archaeon]|nr:endonuclease/exonuclease/phosphatase family protein [Candidatus Woesearchaeota archaeon]